MEYMYRVRAMAIVALLALVATDAVAQWSASSLPDPATITVPDLSHASDNDVVADGWRYFLFHSPDVSFATAYSDLADCYRFLQPADWGSVTVPRFEAWHQPSSKTYKLGPAPYGLIGALMGQMVGGQLDRRDRQAKMRRCMEPRGYTRYSVPRAVWEGIAAMPAEQAVAVQAKIAIGPAFGKVPTR